MVNRMLLFSILVLFCFRAFTLSSNIFSSEYFKRINYNHHERPFYKKHPVNVTIQLTIHSIGPINEARFNLQLGFYIRQWWIDPRLIISNATKHETSMEPLIWVPDIFIVDNQYFKTFKSAIRTVINHKTGEVFLSYRAKTVVPCNMDLRFYPMDKQICPVKLTTFAFNTKDIELFWHDNPVIQKGFITIYGYELLEITTNEKKKRNKVGDTVQIFKWIILNVSVKRTLMFHIYRVYIPSVLLITFAFGSLWVPDSEIPARMGIIVTSFLANTIILQSVTEHTVKVPYITPLQLFLVVNVVVIVLTLVEYLVVLQRRRGRFYVNKGIKDTTPVLIFYNRDMNATEFEQDFEREEVEQEEEEEEEEEQEERENDKQIQYVITQKSAKKELQKQCQIHCIDRICRALFPISYIIFFGVYIGYFTIHGQADDFH